VSSITLYPETRAALSLARRLGRLAPYRAALASFEALFGDLSIIHLDEQLARAAGALAETYALRGYDAVHLASALASTQPEDVFVTWDAELAAAAHVAGLAVAPAL
jgi:predicted nucleic acid-binding protein